MSLSQHAVNQSHALASNPLLNDSVLRFKRIIYYRLGHYRRLSSSFLTMRKNISNLSDHVDHDKQSR